MSKRQRVEWASRLAAPDNITPKNSRSVDLIFDHFKPREQNLEFPGSPIFCLKPMARVS
jgi:hypothetical protein